MQYQLTDEDRLFLSQFDLESIELKDAKDWDGLVNKDGRFYATKPTGLTYWKGSSNLHRDFAEAYYLSKGIPEYNLPKHVEGYDYEIYNALDHLIHVDGWVSCNFSLSGDIYISLPQHDSNKLTKSQKETIFKLFLLNGYPMEKYYEECEPGLDPISDDEIPFIEGL